MCVWGIKNITQPTEVSQVWDRSQFTRVSCSSRVYPAPRASVAQETINVIPNQPPGGSATRYRRRPQRTPSVAVDTRDNWKTKKKQIETQNIVTLWDQNWQWTLLIEPVALLLIRLQTTWNLILIDHSAIISTDNRLTFEWNGSFPSRKNGVQLERQQAAAPKDQQNIKYSFGRGVQRRS